MAAFVNESNQKRLWDVISGHPDVSRAFSDIEEQSRWFREFIRKMHSEVGPVDDKKLRRVNRRTLQKMAEDIKGRLDPKPTQQPQNVNTIYETRQQEYATMFDRPVPPTPNFSEPANDERPLTQNEMNALMESRNEITISNPIASELQSFRNDITTTLSDIVKMISDLKIQVNGVKTHLEAISGELESMKKKSDNGSATPFMFNQLSDDSGIDSDVSVQENISADHENNQHTTDVQTTNETKEDSSVEEVVNISD